MTEPATEARFLQVRVGYHSQCAAAVTGLLAPLRRDWAQRYFFAWTAARSWHHGPHWMLTLDTADHFFIPGMHAELIERVERFLQQSPSPPFDAEKYMALQKQLNEAEAAGIDTSLLSPNNSLSLSWQSLRTLAARYESPEQWRSVFDAETRLLPRLFEAWNGEAQPYRTACELLLLMACVYPPLAAEDNAGREYNGFLSFHSNYLFWRHRLPEPQRTAIDRKFGHDFSEDEPQLVEWLQTLVQALEEQGDPVHATAELLGHTFISFVQLARDGIIHSRSPYGKEQAAPTATVSEFHRRHFYEADGTPYQFNDAFSGYRWLLNIIYKNLPLLEVSALKRQYLNYSLDRLHLSNADSICRIRSALLSRL